MMQGGTPIGNIFQRLGLITGSPVERFFHPTGCGIKKWEQTMTNGDERDTQLHSHNMP